jgi:moderate conductance mechanosensitive channel
LTNSSTLTFYKIHKEILPMLSDVSSLGSLLTARLDVLLSWLLTSGVHLVVVFVAVSLALRAIRLLTNKLDRMLQGLTQSVERYKRAQTLSEIVRAVATTVLLVVATMLVLDELGINLAPLLAAAGIGGLAIGFGAQNLVRDVITGFFILLEDQIRIGDVVQVGDKSGLVESIGLRVLTLRGDDGSVHMIPNGTITTVTNMTKDFSYSLLDVGVAYREDVDEVMAVLKEVGAELGSNPEFSPDILGDLEVVNVDDFAASQVTIKVRIKTLPSKQWRVGRELRRRIKKVFDARGIEIPFPHLTVYFGEPKRGTAPPLHVAFDSKDVRVSQEHEKQEAL